MRCIFVVVALIAFFGCSSSNIPTVCGGGPYVGVNINSDDYCIFHVNGWEKCGFLVSDLLILGKKACREAWPEKRDCLITEWRATTTGGIRTVGKMYCSIPE